MVSAALPKRLSIMSSSLCPAEFWCPSRKIISARIYDASRTRLEWRRWSDIRKASVRVEHFYSLQTSAVLANGRQPVKSFRYLLTDPRQFDILQSGPGWRRPNAIRFETARVHHAARRRGGSLAARGARAATGDAGDWVPSQPVAGCVPRYAARISPGAEGGGLY